MNLKLISLTITLAAITNLVEADTTYLHPGEKVIQNHAYREELQIYCYRGSPKYVIHIWQSVFLHIDLNNDNFVQYDGASPGEVSKKYNEHHSSWSINLFSWKQKNFKLNPFNQSCVGIDSREKYSVSLNVIRIDYWKVSFLIFGIVLFLSAEKLSRNTLFYYIVGVSFGICASFLILIYFISKLFPRKPMMYGVAVCGWTVGVYILQLLWENIRPILTTYQKYVIWYVVCTGLVSFIICYRMGPVTNNRTRNLIKWSLQASSLAAMFCSSEFSEAAMGQIVILLLSYNFPKSWLSKSKTYWRRKFPPKIHLLNNDEYYQQGVKETSKALDELKRYCSSPDCNQWKTVLKLKNIKRLWFASFVEGNSHLSDEEILCYESSIHETELTDDEENSFSEED